MLKLWVVLFAVLAVVTNKVLADDPLGLKGKPLKWSYCNDTSKEGEGSSKDQNKDSPYPIKLTELTIDPNPPKKGAKVKLSLKGSVANGTTIAKGAKATYTVKLGLIQLAKKTVDLCDTLNKLKDVPKCPVEAGEFSVSQEHVFPGEAPAGKYTVEVEAVAADTKTQLICVKAELVMPLIGG
jgi:hypothetical protein